MTSSASHIERFEPRVDSRPDDVEWPSVRWPPAATTVLRGSWVELRPSLPADDADLFAALDHDATWAHVRGRPSTPAGMAAIIDVKRGDPAWFPWTVRLTRTIKGVPAATVVGTTSYLETVPVDARSEIGSTTYDPAVWGTQVNPECKLLLLEYAFIGLGMGRVQFRTDIRNHRSQQAIARLGATYEGILRRYQRRSDETVRDTVLFSIISEDWPLVRQRLQDRLSEYGDSA
jgi:RimJ/RimL family protein N-acetyltransferase